MKTSFENPVIIESRDLINLVNQIPHLYHLPKNQAQEFVESTCAPAEKVYEYRSSMAKVRKLEAESRKLEAEAAILEATRIKNTASPHSCGETKGDTP